MAVPVTEAASNMGSPYLVSAYVLSISFLLVFTGFSGVSNLLTSVVEVPSLGTISLSIVYLFLTVFSIAGPYVVGQLAPHRSVQCSIGPYVIYLICCVIAIDRPDDEAVAWAVLCFGSAVVGIAAAFLWVGQGVYLARRYRAFGLQYTRVWRDT